MANKKLDFNAPLLSVRPALSPTWRPRPIACDNHGLVPFAWEDAPGRPKYVLSNDNGDDNEDEDAFSDALTELSDDDHDERKHEVKHSSDDDEEDDNDDGSLMKGCGLMSRFWLTTTPLRATRAVSRIKNVLRKQKKHVRAWEAILKQKLGKKRRFLSKNFGENQAKGESRQPFGYPCPSSSYSRSYSLSPSRGDAHQPPLSRGRPILDSPRKVFFDLNGAAGIVLSATGRLISGGGDRMDPMYSASGAIHRFSGYGNGPPVLKSPSESWLWMDGATRRRNCALQFHSNKIWSTRSSPKLAWNADWMLA